MSVEGQTPTLRYAGAVSALPQHADVSPKPVKVCISGRDAIVGINEGWNLSAAIKTAERKLDDRSLVHGGQSLMAWAVSNARVEPKGNAIVITKQASGTAKIDPLMRASKPAATPSLSPNRRPAPPRSIH